MTSKYLMTGVLSFLVILQALNVITKTTFVNGQTLMCNSITEVPCDTSLYDVVQSHVALMPTEDSEAYVHPSIDVLEEWEMIVYEMLSQGECNNGNIQLPQILIDSGYEWGIVSDAITGNDYCVLVSLDDTNQDGYVDHPWGIVVVNLDSNNNNPKNISFDIPHPLNDSYTWRQGIQVYTGTNSRTFTLSGSHRRANAQLASCQDSYQIADAAHTINTFFASTVAISQYYTNHGNIDHTHVQFHGMGTSSCPSDDVYFTPGTGLYDHTSGEKLVLLRDTLQGLLDNAPGGDPRLPDPLLALSVPGETSCGLSGGTNVQGRLLNDIDESKVCDVSAHQYSGKFIHIEQKWDMRQNKLVPYWIDSFNIVYPMFNNADPPTRITVTSPNDGTEIWARGTSQTITWTTQGNVPSGDGDVKISLHRNDDDKTFLRTLVDATPMATGTYTLPELSGYAEEGNNFVVRVRSVQNTNYKDYSDHPLSVVNPITITQPIGGAVYMQNNNIQIVWNVMNVPADKQIKLSLHRGSSYRKTIKTSIDSSPGSYTWKIPNYIETDYTYTIRIRLVDETSVLLFSDVFCIGSCDPAEAED